MIHPFRFRDSFLLQRLARQSVPLYLERHLIQPRWPLWTALGAPVPWYGSGVATFVHRQSSTSQNPDGFVQARKRLGRPEAEVRYIAPQLSSHDRARETWQALLEHLIAHAGDFGIQRLYTCLPAEDEAAAIVSGCGFALYVRETLFRLRATQVNAISSAPSHFVRPQRETDSLALQRLADRFTPPVVLKAEGAFFKNGGNHPLIFQNWWQPGHSEGLVYERDGELMGALLLQRGSRGVWLRFLGDPMHQDVMHALLIESMSQLRPLDKPIYCGVRAYQNALGPTLHTFGFEAVTELARFVKHTTVSVQEPATSKTRLLIETTFPGIISSDVQSIPKK